MKSAVDSYEKAGLMDKAEAIRERRKWEEHWSWCNEMRERREDCEVDWDILYAEEEYYEWGCKRRTFDFAGSL